MIPSVDSVKDGGEDRFAVVKPENVRHWKQIRACDTARECEDARASYRADAEKRVPSGLHPYVIQGVTAWQTVFEARLVASDDAVCVPAEHVYPPASSNPVDRLMEEEAEKLKRPGAKP
jgi:hypothetical protein